jgi:endonuclease/exonuclease/phosphatase family metal-dependent hydrolase
MLEVAFDSPAGEWTLFVVHLKSRYTNRSDDPMSAIRRLAEARQLREIVLDRFPDPATARFAVVGDFNDTPDSRPVARFLQRGATHIASLLPAADSRGETWTHRYERADTYSRVDFLLPSPGLLPFVTDGRGTVFDGPSALHGSDHRPVFFEIDWLTVPRP